LARESLSHDSTTSESPAQTPTPSCLAPVANGYFSSLNETFETFKTRNGINSFFSPVKAEEVESKDMVSVSSIGQVYLLPIDSIYALFYVFDNWFKMFIKFTA